MSEEYKLNCEKAKEQLDMLIDCMVEARLKEARSPGQTLEGQNFEPQDALKDHLSDCSECHNYHLANQVLIEAAKSLPRLDAGEDLTQSIMAMIEVEQNAMLEQTNQITTTTTATTTNGVVTQSFFAKHNNIFLIASFIAFTVITSGVFADNAPLADGAASSDWIWSACSWALALVVVAMFKPFIEDNWTGGGQSRTVKA